MIYLDHAATTPMRPGVWEAMAPHAIDSFGNSSGIHGVSRRAKNALEEARERIAEILGCGPMEVVFTSGGTESDNLALTGAVFSGSGRSDVVVGATEHEAVLETADFLRRRGSGVHVAGVDRNGRVETSEIVASLTPTTSLVSLMLVNNETGALNDVAAVSRAVKGMDRDVLVHTDAVQAFGSMKFDVGQLGVDMLSLTAHKFGGPKGAGLLYVRAGTALEPLIHGGGQELGRRSGTHDVAGAVGLATAMELAAADRDRLVGEIGRIRDGFGDHLAGAFPDAIVNTPTSDRSPLHLNIRFPGVRNEALLMRLDREGIAASAGSACQSGAATVSHVLEAMGLSAAEARESVRFSFGWTSTRSEADRAAQVVVDLVGELR
ncbi:MAG: cysteine desulfurase family protein [Acidimicrobiia bacterium]